MVYSIGSYTSTGLVGAICFKGLVRPCSGGSYPPHLQTCMAWDLKTFAPPVLACSVMLVLGRWLNLCAVKGNCRYVCFHLSIQPSIHLSIYPSISMYLSMHIFSKPMSDDSARTEKQTQTLMDPWLLTAVPVVVASRLARML